MASLTAGAATLTVPSFCGLKGAAELAKASAPVHMTTSSTPLPRLNVTASLEREQQGPWQKAATSAAMLAAAATLAVGAGPAWAAKVEVGDEVGSFKFSPETVTVAAGEAIDFELVGETGHNVVFDLPAGAPPAVAQELAANSMGENDLLSEDDPKFSVKLSTPGTYTYYCTPHKSANMKGTIVVK